MTERNQYDEAVQSGDSFEILYRRHFQGALTRSGASVVMWIFALVAFLLNQIRINHISGITLSVLYLILINPPFLLILKHSRRRNLYNAFSMLINVLEIFGYTAVIYFMGGIEALYLTPIYAALITYLGLIAPRGFPFVVSILCSASFSFVVVAEHFGFLPHQGVLTSLYPPWPNQVMILAVVTALLLVVAYISSYTAIVQKKNRIRLREQNFELTEKTIKLEEAEKNLRKAHEELERRIEERTAELKGANDQLRVEINERKQAEEKKKRLEARLLQAQKMEAIGSLAGGVAHDLNNILSGLVSYPELLLMDIPKDSPLRGPILTIQRSGEKAAAIVQDLLTLARRGVPVIEVVNLNRIISDYLNSPEYENLILYHPGIELEADLKNKLKNIMGSPVHLSKTVMNLVSNAAEAMPEGGKIFISTANRYMDHPIKGYDHFQKGDYVTLIVSDTGIGISPEDMERIYEPFYTKKIMGRSGTGLGMAVVWGTVKDHRGNIDVQSTEGKGTTFTLYFPATEKESPREEPVLSIEDYMGRGESILIVDDVKEQRIILSGMLKRLGYRVTAVSSGEEAVEYMKDHTADLLVLDMIMDPGIDGFETYKRILELHPGQKAIIASGYSETERVKELQKMGGGGYIKKPYSLEKIGLAVRVELDK